MKSSLIILTSNEIQGTKALFDEIPFDGFDECFVIDWQSKDGTREFFEKRGIKVIGQDKKGRGEAFRLASEIASGDILVFFSPDGNEDPQDTVKLLEEIKKGYDMVIASRFLPQSRNDQSDSLFPYRSWANQVFTFLVNLFFKGSLSDSINGFRAIKKKKFRELKINAEGFAVEFQSSIRALKLGHKIKEIPTIERERIGGKSKAGSLPVGLNLLKILLTEVWTGKNI